MTCTRLDLLIYQRDKIEEALSAGSDYVELEIRGRRVRKTPSLDLLKYLNGEIDKERSSARTGPARNRAELFR